ncbi:MAG: hypothetical protein VX278_18895 [Myxococcota bacterium]|nr:hypothetical protein [Myxococcota bacterium]
MKYLIDWILATIITIGTFLWIFQEPEAFNISNMQIRSLDGYLVNNPKKTFILHISTFDCQSCKRDTQILMRYHLLYPDIPIIDANVVHNQKQIESIQMWKKKLDIGYTVTILQNGSQFGNRIPTTFVIDPNSNQILEIFGTLTYEKLLDATNKDK